jgi:hypothetical protein
MGDEQVAEQGQVQFLLADFNTRLRDIDERNRLIRERVLLLGKNLISSKQDADEEIAELKRQSFEMKKDVDKLKSLSANIAGEVGKFVKKDEMVLIERMLKDFQPLEFMRKKDVEEMINQKMGSVGGVKTNKN